MDRMIYTAMSSAKFLTERQATLANNLANVSTTGFRADMVAMRAVPTNSQQAGTRVYAIETTVGSDFTPGTLQSTGRSLDAAIQGNGWFAVQTPDGNEAYTRAGGFQVGPDGTLQLSNGDQIVGASGPITIPADTQTVTIGSDGTVTVKTGSSKLPSTAGQLKLVNPSLDQMTKGLDGLFRLKAGGTADSDPAVRVVSGSLESSNVNPVAAMVGMIAAARQFELQMKMLSTAEQNEQKASTVVSSTG
jgi:flagellar basal-body rod protein FlgF